MSYVDGRRSSFPDGGVDQFLELYNLPASQRVNMRRFQELKLKQSRIGAEENELNSLTITLQHYIIDVEKWNKFADAIVNVETFFLEETVGYIETMQTNVNSYVDDKKDELNTSQQNTLSYVDDKKIEMTNYVDDKKSEMVSYTDNKKVEFQTEVDKVTYRGEWQPGIQYLKKNIVTSGGEGFIAKLDNINQPPPNTTHWGKIAEKGAKGDPSLNINYKGEYNVAASYAMGDAVTFGGLWYYTKQNTIGNPPTNTEFWELKSNQTMVGNTQPFDNKVTGWVDTSL